MSVVGSIHIQCGHVGRCGGHVFAVDAAEYLHELGEIVRKATQENSGGYTYPKRYCPQCEKIALFHGMETPRQQDERIAEHSARTVEVEE